MSTKQVFNIATNQIEIVPFTEEEIVRYELEFTIEQEQSLIDSLIPSKEEIAKAELEINTIELLTELGVI